MMNCFKKIKKNEPHGSFLLCFIFIFSNFLIFLIYRPECSGSEIEESHKQKCATHSKSAKHVLSAGTVPPCSRWTAPPPAHRSKNNKKYEINSWENKD